MKKVFLALLLICSVCFSSRGISPAEKINVMTFNIRMDTSSDGENQWSFRKDFAASLVRFYETDLVGMQEVLHHQLTDLQERLPEYAYVGVGREDGATKGEYASIFYRKDRFEVMKTGNFWLAEDKDAVGTKGWDAACERVATWAIFKDKTTGKEFFMLNTHLDHVGKTARHEGAALVLQQANELAKGLPIIVTGDFNAKPEDDPIQVLTNPDDKRHLQRARLLTTHPYGPEWTFHNYGRIPAERRNWIDYIFVKGSFEVLRHGVLTDTQAHLYPSDHYPVLCTLVLK
ncbi:endonuclease/exonuclease/phosphatase family protein [Parabacteroides sp. OttesenSCG-928-G06]|nr:endonuclease/exonuclease/phosphatase family protein [Parabacteroides sp. OttesenSCG-928-G06]